MDRVVLIPPSLRRRPPIAGGHLARETIDLGGKTMGTYWQARVVAPATLSAPDLEKMIQDALVSIVSTMSPWESGSEIERFRRAEPNQWVEFSPDTYQVLRHALSLAELTGGLFDPTIGPLTDALGFGPTPPTQAHKPGSSAAREARTFVDHRLLERDDLRRAVRQPGGFRLDLCSVAKGFAVDRVVEVLASVGVEAALVEIGGEVRGLGCKPSGQPWWCHIALPPGAEGHLPRMVIAAADHAIASSGNLLRRQVWDDESLGHIIPARIEHSLDPSLLSVSVLAPTCLEADGFATALFLLGPERGLAFATEHRVAALFIEGPSWRWRSSPALAAYLA